MAGWKIAVQMGKVSEKLVSTLNIRTQGSSSPFLIKLCPRGAQTCALPLFCDRDLEINLLTLKLESDILKMYLYTENETASLRNSKLRA